MSGKDSSPACAKWCERPPGTGYRKLRIGSIQRYGDRVMVAFVLIVDDLVTCDPERFITKGSDWTLPGWANVCIGSAIFVGFAMR